MSFTLLRASIIEEYNTWTEAWNHLPADRRDVYFLPGYLLANEKVGRGEACCILVEVGEAMLLYPFLNKLQPVADLPEYLLNFQCLNYSSYIPIL